MPENDPRPHPPLKDSGGDRWARWTGGRAGPVLLFACAVVEGCLVPAPTEAVFAALAIARPRRAWALGALAAAGSVLGGVIAWHLGATAFDRYGQPLLARYGLMGELEALGALYRRNAALALLTSGYTPVPYLLYGTVGGATGVPLGTFVVFCALGRGLKYAVLAGVARIAGPPVRRWLARNPRRIALVVTAVALIVLGAWMI
ncbi:MAG TPA: VTT domain-containing protein [Longimicrobium sp.]|jgi:membrane protein YqaA with SNARE-associated domain|uniref:YqaA family protein n=1 Tax=Longimicrobium sp. TaxID=2029185 RepID=UPI002EDAFA62